MQMLTWKYYRLRAMSGKEIVFRAGNFLQNILEARGFGLARDYSPSDTNGKFLDIDPVNIASKYYSVSADKILNGVFTIFNMPDVYLGFPLDWNKDPKLGVSAPLTIGNRIDYRDNKIVGDIKYLWELNRHLDLVTLAQAFFITGDAKYMHGCFTLLCSWFKQCPYPYGVNWTSSLELAIRLVNWAFTWALLDEKKVFLRNKIELSHKKDWLKSIYQHCHYINGHLSKHSSSNNHLFGEFMGLFIASTVWPCWKESRKWQQNSKKGIEEEALKQNFSDGCNREQGIWYHHEVADMMLLCGLVGRANDDEFSREFWCRLESMLEFIASMMDVGGNVPMIGDSDDAVMIRFYPDRDFSVFNSLLATGAVLFDRADFARKAGKFDEKSRWLLGKEGEEKYISLLKEPKSKPTAFQNVFPQGGYYILGKDLDTDQEVRLIADAGPLGYLSVAAHGHADALSLVLSIGGQGILIDSGTYAYHTERRWRDYFKGTSAHNTVRIDGVDQSVSRGNFLWIKHAQATCESFSMSGKQDVFSGSHNGYSRLKDPVKHRRTIEFDKIFDKIEISDTIECKKQHSIELFWHFAETCNVTVNDKAVSVTKSNIKMQMTMPESGFCPELYIGNEELPLGWISRRFDVKMSTPTILWSGDVDGTDTLRTKINYQISY